MQNYFAVAGIPSAFQQSRATKNALQYEYEISTFSNISDGCPFLCALFSASLTAPLIRLLVLPVYQKIYV